LILAAPSTLINYLVNPRRSEYSAESCCSIDPGCWIDPAARLVLAALAALVAQLAPLALPTQLAQLVLQTLLARSIPAAPSTLVSYLVNSRCTVRSGYSFNSFYSIDFVYSNRFGCSMGPATRLVLAALAALATLVAQLIHLAQLAHLAHLAHLALAALLVLYPSLRTRCILERGWMEDKIGEEVLNKYAKEFR
jgi:hypothetical protein